jgi:DNA modification methylase
MAGMAQEFRCLNQVSGDTFSAINGDCVDVVRQLPDKSVGFSVYSPPFGDLFIYSDSEADMGNSSSDGEFFDHYEFLIEEMARVMKPGRLAAVHCSDLPYRKWKDGKIGIKDFSGDIIRAHERHGFTLHSRVTIWKCPVVEMTRTKALGLLYKQLQKDSSRSRTGMPDYLLVFRAPGENEEPIGHTPGEFPVDQWQQWASPVWMDIQQTNTLNVKMAKENKDEKHLCPLQLDLIERALILWSNPGDVVLSPFMGIGSEGFMSVKIKRKFIGVELKESYWKQACKNIAGVEAQSASLFDFGEAA